MHAGPGLDLVMGNDGQDFIFLGTDMGSEVFAGTGNDFIYGNKNAERILGNEGDDWIETGTFDGAPGDNFDEIFSHDEIDGNDVFLGDGGFDEFIGEGGDEIFVGSPGRGKMVGMSGFDWATYKDNTFGVNADLSIPIVFDEAPTLPQNAALDEYESVEGLSGTKFNDVLKGSNTLAEERLPASQGGTEGYQGSSLTAGYRADQWAAGGSRPYGRSACCAGARRCRLQRRRHHPRRRRQRPDPGQCRRRHHRRRQVAERAHRHRPASTQWSDGSEIAHRWQPQDIRSMTSPVTLTIERPRPSRSAPGCSKARSIPASCRSSARSRSTRRAVRHRHGQFQGVRSRVRLLGDRRRAGDRHRHDRAQLDGSDRLRNIERVQFADGSALNIIVGTPNNDVLNGTAQDDLMLGLGGNDVLNGGDGNDILVGGPNAVGNATSTFIDNFGGSSYSNNNGTANFNGGWVEGGGETPTSPTRATSSSMAPGCGSR